MSSTPPYWQGPSNSHRLLRHLLPIQWGLKINPCKEGCKLVWETMQYQALSRWTTFLVCDGGVLCQWGYVSLKEMRGYVCLQLFLFLWGLTRKFPLWHWVKIWFLIDTIKFCLPYLALRFNFHYFLDTSVRSVRDFYQIHSICQIFGTWTKIPLIYGLFLPIWLVLIHIHD
jgi:hypothetical protein